MQDDSGSLRSTTRNSRCCYSAQRLPPCWQLGCCAASTMAADSDANLKHAASVAKLLVPKFPRVRECGACRPCDFSSIAIPAQFVPARRRRSQSSAEAEGAR